MQAKSPALAKDIVVCASRFGLDDWCLCGPGSEKTWTSNEERPSHQLADGERDKLALRVIREFITSKQPHSVQVFEHSSDWCIVESRARRRSSNTYLKHEPENHLLSVNMILACYQCCVFFAVKIGFTSTSHCILKFPSSY